MTGKAWAVLLLFAAGCHSEGDSVPLRMETQHFRYHADKELPVCKDLLEAMEAHYAAVTSWLGVALEAGEKIDYYRFSDSDELGKTGCRLADGTVPGGCAEGLLIVTTRPFETHELVHAYSSLLGSAPRLFDEGLATMLGETGANQATIDASFPVESFLDPGQGQLPADAYGPAAGLTRYLVDRYGHETYLRFYASLRRQASRTEIEAAVQSSFDVELAALLEAWRAERPVVETSTAPLYLAECANPPLSDDDAFETACWQETFPLRLTRSFSLTEPSGIVLRARHAAGASTSVTLRACDGTVHRSLSTYLWPDAAQHELLTDLAAGDYYLEAFADEVKDAVPSIALDAGGPLVADTCAGAEERIVSDATGVIHVERWPDASDSETLLMNVRLDFESARRVQFRARASSVTVCRGGCEEQSGSECTAFEPTTALPDTPPEVSIDSLELEAGAYAFIVETTPETFSPGWFTLELSATNR